MRTKFKGRLSLLFLALSMVLAVPAVALADNIKNDIETTAGADSVVNATIGQSVTVGYWVQATGGTCDAQDTTGVTLTPRMESGSGNVTIDPTSVTLKKCGDANKASVSFTADAAGEKVITVGAEGSAGDEYNTMPAKFKLNVTGTGGGDGGGGDGGGGGGGGGGTPAVNNLPIVVTAAVDALGTEGDTLTASGRFSDPDGHSLSLSADNTQGRFFDNGDGTWNWSLSTNDDEALSTITVTANDGNGGTVTDSFDYRALNADPNVQDLSLNTGANNTACLNGKSVGLSFNITDPGTADEHRGTIDWGDGSAPEVFTGPSVSNLQHSYVGAGSFNITVIANDDNGGKDIDNSLSGSNGVNLTYNMSSGLLSPVNADGSSVFKLGSTIPMKVKITDCADTAVSGLSPSIRFLKVATGALSGVNEGTSTSSADTNYVMRYSDGQYIYNLASKSLGEGGYNAVIGEANSTPSPMTSQAFGIRK